MIRAADVLPYALPVVIAVLAALSLLLAGLLQYRLADRVAPQAKVATVMVVLGIGALLSVALTQRNLNESLSGQSGALFYEDLASGFAASRWISLVLIGAALIEIVRGWLQARRVAAPDPAWPLLATMLMFYLGTLLIQGIFSEHTGFSHQQLYLPIVLMAVYFQPVRDLGPVLGAAKLAVLGVTLGSLIGIAVQPDFVLHRPDDGVIPGIDWRLYGLTPHANAIGPIALLGILLELYSPSRFKGLRLLNLGAGVAVFVLAQSRTAWGAALLIALVTRVPLAVMPDGGPARGPVRGLSSETQGFNRAVRALVGCTVLMMVLAIAIAALGSSEYWQRQSDLGSLNGRVLIWDITLDAWQENRLFGYGPEIWGLARRMRFSMFHVGHAHNQIVQTLGEAGLAGVLLLALYLGALLYAACRRFAVNRGFVLALLLLLLARWVTEAPMRSEGLLSWASFLHALLLVVACHHLRQPQHNRSDGSYRNDPGVRKKGDLHKPPSSRYSVNPGISTQ